MASDAVTDTYFWHLFLKNLFSSELKNNSKNNSQQTACGVVRPLKNGTDFIYPFSRREQRDFQHLWGKKEEWEISSYGMYYTHSQISVNPENSPPLRVGLSLRVTLRGRLLPRLKRRGFSAFGVKNFLEIFFSGYCQNRKFVA